MLIFVYNQAQLPSPAEPNRYKEDNINPHTLPLPNPQGSRPHSSNNRNSKPEHMVGKLGKWIHQILDNLQLS